MQYDFLNENTLEILNNKQIDNKFLSAANVDEQTLSIAKNNLDVAKIALKFLHNDSKVLIINSFMGAGKSKIIDFLQLYLNEKVLFFRTNYYNATHLDDILLSLFSVFTSYHNKKIISLPKVDTTIFSERINAYIKAANHPMLFVFDSLELRKLTKEQQKDILDFIFYLSNIEKVKIIIGSRNLDEEDLLISCAKTSVFMKPMENTAFTNILRQKGIQDNVFCEEEAFKNTKGHYLYVSVMTNLLNLLNISLSNFMNEFAKRDIPFPEFLFGKAITLIPERYLNLLCFLTFIRIGVGENFLMKQNLAQTEGIKYLKERGIIIQESGLIYLKDYFKKELIKSIDIEVQLKVHEYLYELYGSQLPKKPNERDLVISRVTMRKEMSFHKESIENSKETDEAKQSNDKKFSYLSYSRSNAYEWEFENSPIASDSREKKQNILQGNNNEKIQRFELSLEEKNILNSAAKAETRRVDYINVNKDNLEKLDTFPMGTLIKLAQEAEDKFEYNKAVLLFNLALEKETDPDFEIRKPLIITKIAICYKKMQQIEKAIREYEKVFQIYSAAEDEKAYYILLSIAQIYNESYKFIQAKETYQKILDKQDRIQPELKIRVFLDLAEIEESSSNIAKSWEYLEKALFELPKTSDLKLRSEIYFKCGLFMDDAGKIDIAMNYYLKSIVTSNEIKINSYLSSAYSNLAAIYSEKNNSQEAIKYYKFSIEADKILKNYEGLYLGYSKLANLQKAMSEQRLGYLIKALNSAKKLDDKFYAASVYIEIGDFYYNIKQDKMALKAYINAKNIIVHEANEENIKQISDKINELKVRLGNDKFIKFMKEFQK